MCGVGLAAGGVAFVFHIEHLVNILCIHSLISVTIKITIQAYQYFNSDKFPLCGGNTEHIFCLRTNQTSLF